MRHNFISVSTNTFLRRWITADTDKMMGVLPNVIVVDSIAYCVFWCTRCLYYQLRRVFKMLFSTGTVRVLNLERV